MWKRVLVVIIALVGTFSVVYATNGDMFAATTYNAGGAVTGRVNKAPANLTVTSGNTSIGMQKGDKILIGENNPLDGKPLGFQLLQYHANYTDYGVSLLRNSAIGDVPNDGYVANNGLYAYENYPLSSPANKSPINGWLSLTTKPITPATPYMNYGNDAVSYFWHGFRSLNEATSNKGLMYLVDINSTAAYVRSKSLFDALDNKSKYKIINDKDLTTARSNSAELATRKLSSQNSLKHILFIMDPLEMNTLSANDLAFSTGYWLNDIAATREGTPADMPTLTAKYFLGGYVAANGNYAVISDIFTGVIPFRPALYLNMDSVIFATSPGSSSNLAKVSQPKLSSGYTSIYEDTKNDRDMKVRVLNSAYNATLLGLSNTSNQALKVKKEKSETVLDSTILLNANANAVSGSTVSVLVFDQDGNFKYYKPLEPAKGAGTYTFDTSDIPVGEYQIAIVNEAYSDSITIAADSSLLSDVQNLRIVEPLEVNYTATPKDQSTYEYSKNVGTAIKVGSVSYVKGAGTPTLSIVETPGYANEYLNFELSSTIPTVSPVDVKIKNNARDLVNGSLKAGVYHFRIQGSDGNGDTNANAFKDVILTVEKTKVTLSFTDSDPKDISIGKDLYYNNSIISNNTDLSSITKPSYSLTSTNNSGTLTNVQATDAKAYIVNAVSSYTGDKLPDTYTLTVTTPETDNFKASTVSLTNPVEKKIFVYKEMSDLIFTPTVTGDFTTKEVIANKVIGTLSASDGISPHTFTKTTSADDGSNYIEAEAKSNPLIAIDSNTNEVKTVSNLSIGKHYFQFKVTDTKNKTIYKSVEINVVPVGQGNFSFKDKAGGTDLSELSVEYAKGGSKQLFAEGGSGSGAITYKLKDGQPTDTIEVTSSGELSWKKIGGPVIVEATKAGDGVFDSITAELKVTINNGNQTVKFSQEAPTFKMVGDTSFDFIAKLTRDDSSTSTIAYSSTYPDVCTIASDGKITIVGAGTCEVKAENNDANYVVANDTKSFPVYDKITGTFEQNTGTKPLSVGKPAGTLVGVIKDVSGGDHNYSYRFKNTTNLFTISPDGSVNLSETLTKEDLVGKWSDADSSYVINETIVITDGKGNTKDDVTAKIICQGETPTVTIEGAPNNKLHKSYDLGSFDLKAQNVPTGNTIKYEKVEDSAGLLSTITEQGKVGIQKAGTSTQFAKIKATMPPNNGYEAQIIDLEIYIDKATQSVVFDAGTYTSYKFIQDGTFTVEATATQTGSTITYESKTSDVCTISGNTVTMKTMGNCKLIAKASLANYEDATSSEHTINLYDGAKAEFTQTANNLQALPDTETIPAGAVAVGNIKTTGGLNGISYAFSNNVSEANGAKDLFEMSTTSGNVTNISLKKNVSAGELALHGVYDATNDIYLLKFQVDVFDGANKLDNPVDCVVKIKGAKLTLSFNNATAGTITEVYKPNGYFDLSVKGNTGNGKVTYVLTEVVGKEKDIVILSDNRLMIQNADDEMPVITATVDAKEGYEKQTISTNIKINKANQDKFFLTTEQQNLKLSLDGTATLNPPVNDSGETLVITSDPSDVVEVLADGKTIHALKAGSAIISIKSPGNRNYNEKTLTINVNVFGSLSGTITQTEAQILQANKTANINQIVGTFQIEGGLSPINNITATLAENPNIKMTNNGSGNYTLRLRKTITATDLETCTYDAVNDVYLLPISIEVYDPLLPVDEQRVTITDNIKIEGADMDADITFTDAQNGKITKVYSLGGSLPFSLEERDYIDPATITYRLKSGSATDVISQPGIEDGTYVSYIDAASQASDPKVYVEAIIPSQKGYTGMIVETEIEITQAEQTFKFAQESMNLSLTDKSEHLITVGKGVEGRNPTLTMDPIGIVTIKGTSSKPTISSTGLGSTTITASDVGNRNYKPHSATTEVTVFDGASIDLVLGATPQAETDSSKNNSPVGTYSTQGGLNTVNVDLDATFTDNQYFKLLNGTLVFNQDIDASILSTHPYDTDKQAYVMQVKFILTDGTGIPVTSTKDVYVKGAPIKNVSFIKEDGTATSKLEKTYYATGTPFMLELSGKVGNTWPYGTVTYGLKVVNSPEADGSSTIITSIDPTTGATIIENANLNGVGSDEKAYATAVIAPANGYAGTETPIECELYINQAEQSEFKFKESIITINVGSQANPEYQGNLTSNAVTIDTDNHSIATYDERNDMITGIAAGETILRATAPEDRNYKIKNVEARLIVQNASGYDLILKGINPATYGDAPIQAEIKTNGAQGTNKTQTWYSSDPNVASIDDTGLITIHKAGTTAIKVSQTTELETTEVFSQSIPFTVNKKNITVQISDKAKYVGQANPTFTIEPVTELVTGDTFEEPLLYICQDDGGNYVNEYTKAGSYDIKAIFDTNANPNYTLGKNNENLKYGTLTIRQDVSDPSWYTVRSDAILSEPNGWYNKEVNLDLKEGQDYDEMSDKIDGTYAKTIPVQEEGIHDKDIYFKASLDNKIAAPQEKEIKVDMTQPQITSVAGKKINDDTFARVMNTLTLNAFFKPGSEITINAQDIAPQTGIITSGLAKIDYEVHSEVADENGNTLIKQDSVIGDKATFTLDDLGDYNICAIATDNAGNASPQTCQKATVKKIDVDVDGDGKPDFNDPNGDGCPDLNIKWKDPSDPTKWIIINGDRDYDGIPDLNVDSDGDGKPNLNIDTDGDNLPDINLVILKKGDWTAGTCIVGEAEEYSGGTTSVKPQINIDTGNDQIPDINFDTNGDMKADYNINKDNDSVALADRKPQINLGPTLSVWTPNFCNTKEDAGGFLYCTVNNLKPVLNIDTDSDGLPDINLDRDQDDVPELNVDINDDRIPDINIDGDGDGIADINPSPNGDGKIIGTEIKLTKWKPNKDVDLKDGKLVYDTMSDILQEDEDKDILEDTSSGITVQNKNKDKFKANYRLIVENVTEQVQDDVLQRINKQLKGNETIKTVYEVSVYMDTERITIDSTLIVSIPCPKDVDANAVLLAVEQKDESYKIIKPTIEEKNLVYETDYLGHVGLIIKNSADHVTSDDDKTNDETDMDKNVGGAFTGDDTNLFLNMLPLCISFTILYGIRKKTKNRL